MDILSQGGDKMISIWSDTSNLPNFAALNEDIKTDVLIIGGGMAGILCAYQLAQQGVDYVLVEANAICSGITKNTTAKITSQHGLLYQKIEKEFNLESAAMYLKANQNALEQYRKLCQDMDCGFENKDNFVYSLEDPKKLEKEVEILHKIGYNATLKSVLPLPFQTAGAVMFPDQAQFNPLQFVSQIVKNLRIYEYSKVEELVPSKTGPCKALIGKRSIVADKIIVATHFPFLNKHGSYFLKMYQHRSYAITVEDAQDVHGMYVDEAQKGMSFRNYKNLLIIGGGDHRTGKKGGNWSELFAFQKKYYPDCKVEYNWATQDCMTLDSIPYIGQYSAKTDNFYVATGFNKWGMTSSMVAANILTDMVTGKQNEYASVFSPSRSILRGQLAVNGFEAVTNLLSITPKRCPHLGCALKWNEAEHSWDCPCHGSRFTEEGKLIDNPATGDLK